MNLSTVTFKTINATEDDYAMLIFDMTESELECWKPYRYIGGNNRGVITRGRVIEIDELSRVVISGIIGWVLQ
jgi:hypothetical protein